MSLNYSGIDGPSSCSGVAGIYYPDNTFLAANYMWSDPGHTTYAINGYYSNGSMYKQLTSGIFGGPISCSIITTTTNIGSTTTSTTTPVPTTTTTTTLPPHSYNIYTNLTTGSSGIKIYYKIASGSWTLIGNYSPASFSICPGSSTLITTLSIPYGNNVSVAIRNSSFDADITFGESPISCGSSTGFFGQSSFYTRSNVINDETDYFTAQI